MDDPYDLDQVLVEFPTSQRGASDVFTIADALESLQIFGVTGGGKSSGSGKTFAKAFLRQGFGILVLCAKTDQKDDFLRYVRDCGREKDVIIFSAEGKHRFNFLDYEFSLPDSSTEDVVQLLSKGVEFAEQGQGSGNSADPFWKRSEQYMLRNAVDFLGLGTGSISLSSLMKVINSAPQHPEDVEDPAWQENSFLYEVGMQMSDEKFQSLTPIQKRDYDLSVDYWLNIFPNIDERTRSGVVSGFTSMASGLQRGVMHELFSTGTTFTPEQLFNGAIIIADLPIKKHSQLGIIGQGLLKYLTQRAIERRDIKRHPRPVALWVDESQNFVNSYDAVFQSTARSKRGATVYLTQSISNYYASIGGMNPVHSTDALLSNFATLIAHTNRDAKTNNWLSEQISKSFHDMSAISSQNNQQQGRVASTNISQQLHFDIQPSTFLSLRNGGERNDLLVDAVILKAGRQWSETNRPHRIITFDQSL